jgi:hypothetical protein
MAINETATGNDSVAITGTASAGARTVGVKGIGDSVGVQGKGKAWHGVEGISDSTIGGFGVYGANTAGGTGVVGESKGWMGVYGRSESTSGGAGVMGEGDPAHGVIGKSTKWIGVYGETAGIENGSAGVWGEHKGAGVGVKAVSKDGEAVHAETRSPGTAAIAAYNLNQAGTGAAIFARKEGALGHAGFFDGRVWIGGELGVGGDIILPNADCAEDFDVAEAVPVGPGSVVVIGSDGALRECVQPYDGCVAGIISGAGSYCPALVLDRAEKSPSRQPVALIGKVFCKVDADFGAISAGDMLTTSSTRGYAMKASDRQRAFGAVVGKALAPLASGRGLIPVLVTSR